MNLVSIILTLKTVDLSVLKILILWISPVTSELAQLDTVRMIELELASSQHFLMVALLLSTYKDQIASIIATQASILTNKLESAYHAQLTALHVQVLQFVLSAHQEQL